MSMPLSATIPPKRRSTDWHCNIGPALSPAKRKIPPPRGHVWLGLGGLLFSLIPYAKLTNVRFSCKQDTLRHLADLVFVERIKLAIRWIALPETAKAVAIRR
jgi:hypothetical protein